MYFSNFQWKKKVTPHDTKWLAGYLNITSINNFKVTQWQETLTEVMRKNPKKNLRSQFYSEKKLLKIIPHEMFKGGIEKFHEAANQNENKMNKRQRGTSQLHRLVSWDQRYTSEVLRNNWIQYRRRDQHFWKKYFFLIEKSTGHIVSLWNIRFVNHGLLHFTSQCFRILHNLQSGNEQVPFTLHHDILNQNRGDADHRNTFWREWELNVNLKKQRSWKIFGTKIRGMIDTFRNTIAFVNRKFVRREKYLFKCLVVEHLIYTSIKYF